MITRLSYIDKVTIKVLFFTLVSIVAIPYYFLNGGTFLGFVLIRIVAQVFANFGQIGSHRWLCHNSFKPNKLGKLLMFCGMVLGGYGRPMHVVVAHRLHHAHADTVKDPHSPKYHSFWNLWLGRFTIRSGVRVPKDFFRNKEAMFVSDNYWLIYWSFNIVLALIDLKTALVFCPVTFVNSWTWNTIINYYGHYGNTIEPKNLNRFATIMTAGEGLHKNHHIAPSSYNFSSADRTDPAVWTIENILMDKTGCPTRDRT